MLTLKSFTLYRGHIWRSSLHIHVQTLCVYTFITGPGDRGIKTLGGIWGASAVEKKKGMARRLRSVAAMAQSKYGFFCLSLFSSNKAFKTSVFWGGQSRETPGSKVAVKKNGGKFTRRHKIGNEQQKGQTSKAWKAWDLLPFIKRLKENERLGIVQCYLLCVFLLLALSKVAGNLTRVTRPSLVWGLESCLRWIKTSVTCHWLTNVFVVLSLCKTILGLGN